VQMPEMDGHPATTAIRKAEEGTGIHMPIVALTAHAMSGDREACIAAGADGYLAKPINPKDLFAIIESLTAPTSTVAEERVVASAASEAAFDLDDVTERVDGDLELLGALVRSFRESVPNSLAEIRNSARLRDAATLQLAAHGLRGACANMSGAAAVLAAYAVESMGERGDFDDVDARITELEREVHRLLHALAEANLEQAFATCPESLTPA
jgi:two-component system sensor histidine kinase/response regulator